MLLYNTLTKTKEQFKPLKKKVRLFTCGPTVYDYAHIGNLRSYVFEDILKRTLLFNGYKVKHVMNITDVGHLTSDADTGEDKIEKGAKREGKTAWQIADFYTKEFKKDIEKLNIIPPDIYIKATDTIKDQIKLISLLEKKGFTYKTSDGIYFDSSKLKTYGRFFSKKEQLKPGARIDMREKKNHTDFALWKFSITERQMEWDSPWGKGFPGWHTECVVMGIKELGIPFDIHCGGVDHVLIHHTNEIAQAEAGYNKLLANYWLHNEHLLLKDGKMAKSEGNIILLKDVNALAYRYLLLTVHYRTRLVFSSESLKAAENALNNLKEKISHMNKDKLDKKELEQFKQCINNDLDTPKAVALMWKTNSYPLLMEMDKIFGLNLKSIKKKKIPKNIIKLAEQRQKYRKNNEFNKADEIRKEIEGKGYTIEDTESGFNIT